MKQLIKELNEITSQQDLVGVLNTVSKRFNQARFSSALGQEDQVITHTIFTNDLPIEIFTLDTGRLFEQSYELLDRTMARYKRQIKVYYPNQELTQELVQNQGINGFYHSFENRKSCCFIRKVEPLKRALKNADLWVTGLRAEQSANREQMKMFEWDEGNQIIKFNPLIHWTYDEMIQFIQKNNIPYNSLHDEGYVSIGCAPCTRSIEPGEDPRAGRWWWESSKKECGLHTASV